MPRARDPNRNKAFQIYMDAGGKIDLVEIASQLNISAGTLRAARAQPHSEIKMRRSMEPIPGFIGIRWMKTNWI